MTTFTSLNKRSCITDFTPTANDRSALTFLNAQMAGTPVQDPLTGAGNNVPPGQQSHTPPGSASRRVLAQKALNLAAKTPLPDQFGGNMAV